MENFDSKNQSVKFFFLNVSNFEFISAVKVCSQFVGSFAKEVVEIIGGKSPGDQPHVYCSMNIRRRTR